MSGFLLPTEDDPVTLTARTTRLLLKRGSGDAALLYLALLQSKGNVPPRFLARDLHWDMGRVDAAEQVLRELGLIAAPELSVPEPEERPVYQDSDVANRLDDSQEFRQLTDQVEQLLGKKLTTADLKRLLSLYDNAGLPAHIIYQLVNHCIRRTVDRYGTGRRPSMRQIENTGYSWVRRGLYTQAALDRYLKKSLHHLDVYAPYMAVLDMEGRTPVDAEESFLSVWVGWGFSPEAVAIAYGKTVLQCHKFDWKYCNGILRHWHEAGLHTPSEISTKNVLDAKREKSSGDILRKYVQELHESRR